MFFLDAAFPGLCRPARKDWQGFMAANFPITWISPCRFRDETGAAPFQQQFADKKNTPLASII